MPDNRADVVLLSEVYDGSDARVMRWLRGVGDVVTQNEPLVEIETDKVTVEVAAPASGRLSRILKQASDSIATGEVLGHIELAAADSPAMSVMTSAVEQVITPKVSPPTMTGARSGETGGAARELLSPAVRTLLQARGLDAASVRGSGKEGRITARDVDAYAESGAQIGRAHV